MRFIDTNILLYRVSTDPAEARKRGIASDLLEATDLRLSVQVLQEFYVQATRPTRPQPLAHKSVIRLIQSWQRYPIVPLTVELMEKAFETHERWRISYWDAAIVEAARASECEQLLTEDLQDGQNYGGVQVVNPFL